jgi:hypothetical protein
VRVDFDILRQNVEEEEKKVMLGAVHIIMCGGADSDRTL